MRHDPSVEYVEEGHLAGFWRVASATGTTIAYTQHEKVAEQVIAADLLEKDVNELQTITVELAQRVSILELALRLYDRKTMSKDSEGFIAEATAITVITDNGSEAETRRRENLQKPTRDYPGAEQMMRWQREFK